MISNQISIIFKAEALGKVSDLLSSLSIKACVETISCVSLGINNSFLRYPAWRLMPNDVMCE